MKQPFAIAMRTGYPFGLGGMWESWKELGFRRVAGEPSRSSPPMSLGAEIHNRTRYWYRRGVTTAIASTSASAC